MIKLINTGIILLSGVIMTNQLQAINNAQAYAIGIDAYICAYPLVLTQVTKDVMIKKPTQLNNFMHLRQFPTNTFGTIVRPNVDTLYSNAWVDLSAQPVILSLPDTHGTYYVMELMDAWTNVFAAPGKRTTGTKKQDIVLVGPHYKGKLPKQLKKIVAPTNLVWILGRTQTDGPADYAHVHAIQDGYLLTTLDCWQKECTQAKSYAASKNTLNVKPVDLVDKMNAQEFYTAFAVALKNNRPAPADRAILKELKKIGIVPGKDFAADPEIIAQLDAAIPAAKNKIAAYADALGTVVNGWHIATDLGIYKTNYLKRAAVALMGIGANLPQDAIYPTAFIDGDGKQLNGKNNYTIHFEKNELPPANGFWSITVYDKNSFLIKNPINRFALGNRDDFMINDDGSVDFYLQHDQPESNLIPNWLPTPTDDFNLTMRVYWPQKSVLNGTWQPPAIAIAE